MSTVVEIHPPFADYTDWPGFLTAYQPFEQALLSRWPAVRILMENRAGTQYRAPFLLSRPIDFITLARLIRERSLRLRITWDIPQLFTALNSRPSSMQADLYAIAPALEWIDGIHLWGKSEGGAMGDRRMAHQGDLNTYFHHNQADKQHFLRCLADLLANERPRFFVPEVNSRQADLHSIVQDLLEAGFVFLQ